METVQEILDDGFGLFVGESGTCSEDEAFAGLNAARKELWNKVEGNNYVCEYIALCCAPNCFYLPSAYQQVMLAWIGGCPISLGNEWYQSLPGVGFSTGNSCHRKMVNVGGRHVTYQNYDKAPYQVALQIEDNNDIGTEITFWGVDQYGTKRKDVLTAKAAPGRAKTNRLFKSVTSVVKKKTKGRVRLYAVHPVTGEYLLLAVYQPYDTNPTFQKFSIGTRGNCELTVFAKKKYHKLDELTDLVEFPVLALQFAARANTYKLVGNNAGFTENLALAVAELNRQTADEEIPTASPMRFMHSDLSHSLQGPYGGIWGGYGGWGVGGW